MHALTQPHHRKDRHVTCPSARHPRTIAVAACAAVALLAGCGPRSAGPSAEPAPGQTPQTAVQPATELSTPARTAVTYALAARSWTPETYRSQYETQLRLAVGRLRRELARVPPTPEQLAGYRRDQARATATVANVRTLLENDRQAEYSVVLDERNIAAGQQLNERTTNLVTLANRAGQWRVTAFTIQP